MFCFDGFFVCFLFVWFFGGGVFVCGGGGNFFVIFSPMIGTMNTENFLGVYF